MKLGLRKVPEVRLRSDREEGLIVLSPHDQRGRLLFPEEGLPGRIGVDVALIILEQLDLDSAVLRSGEKGEGLGPGVRAHPLGTLPWNVAQVLPILDPLGADEGLQCGKALRRAILVEAPEQRPTYLAQPLEVGVGILDHQPPEAFRMRERYPEAHRRPE